MRGDGLVKRRLHVDDFAEDLDKQSTFRVSEDLEVEGISANYARVNIVTLYSVLEKIPAIFFVIAWISYLIDPYIPVWDYDEWFIRFNPVKEVKNFIVCNASTVNSSELWAPSLLRMTALHSVSSVFLRASILPIFFARLLLLFIILSKWRYLRGDNLLYLFPDSVMYVLLILELFSLSIFVIGNHPLDDARIHKLISILFVIITVTNMLAMTGINYHMEQLKPTSYTSPVLLCFTIIFSLTVIPVLYAYYSFVDYRLCSPLVKDHLFVMEIAAFVSYIFFYWKSKANIEDVELFMFSSISDLEPETLTSIYKPRIVEESIKKYENVELSRWKKF